MDEDAGLVAVRPGERPLAMAEELVLEEIIRDSRTVDGDEAGVGVPGLPVDGAGNHFLAGAAFADEQYRGAGRRDFTDHVHEPLHGEAFADDEALLLAAIQLAAQPLVVERQPPVFEQPANLGEYFVEQDWLHQVVVGAALEGGDGVFDRAVRGDQEHERFRIDLEQASEQFQPVHAGELHVAQGKIETRLARPAQRDLGRFTRSDGETLLREKLGETGPNDRLVVDDQDVGRSIRHRFITDSGFV